MFILPLSQQTKSIHCFSQYLWPMRKPFVRCIEGPEAGLEILSALIGAEATKVWNLSQQETALLYLCGKTWSVYCAYGTVLYRFYGSSGNKRQINPFILMQFQLTLYMDNL